MTDRFCFMMDLKEELTLLLHMQNKIVKFKQFPHGLYYIYSNDENSFILTKKQYQFMNTIEENLKCLSPGQKKSTKGG